MIDAGRCLIYIYIKYIHGRNGMQIAKWGNSLAVRLPAAVVAALGLKEGDEIEIHVAGSRQFGIARKPGRGDLLKRLRGFRGRLPPDFKFDRDEANAR
jgi:antitoxin MazE